MRSKILARKAVVTLVAFLLLAGGQLWAQESPQEEQAPAEVPAANTEVPPPADEAAPAETPEAVPADAPTEVQTEAPTEVLEPEAEKPITEEVPVAEPVEETAPVEAEQATKAPKSRITIQDRVSIGLIGSDLAFEFGFQAEWAAPHFGVSFFWANYQPVPNTINFSWDLGWVFHYYPLGGGPGNLYVGPGFMLMHIEKDPDPLRQLVVPKDLVDMGLVLYEDRQRQKFDLLGPIVEIGYRYRFDIYLTLGISTTVGYLFSDQRRYHGDSFYLVATPQVGFSW